jgi:PAS domain S-box-containing protein
MDWINAMFSADGFMPHGHCYLWRPALLWLHVISDGLIALAYATIPFTIIHFVRRRRDLPFSWMFLCFGMFIIACGATHVMEIWTLWVPVYWLSGFVKAVTALASVPTAILLVQLIPKALAIPTLDSLRATSEAVAASAAQFRALLESAPDAMVIVDARGKIVMINAQTERLFGYRREQLVGHLDEVLLPERLRAEYPARRAAFFAAPGRRALDADLGLSGRRENGSEFPIEVSVSPIEAPGGLLASIAVRDITERNQTQARVRALAIAAQVVDAAPYAMVMAGPRGIIKMVNHEAEQLFGYGRDELIGHPLELLLPERLRDAHAGHVREFGGSPKARTMGAGRELLGLHKSGTEIPVEIGLGPVETSDGLFTLASIVDITERKAREDALQRSNAELEQFAYVASHDLQEPLRMVASYTELLGQRYKGQLDDKADKYIHYAVDGAKRMQRLVADLLAYSRVGSQGKPMVPVDCNAVLSYVLTVLAEPIQQADAVIDVGSLPIVQGDEGQIGQLLQNLIGNALKFRGPEPLRIAIEARLHRGRWLFSVTDNGIGVDMQHAERIFEMFQRLHERGKYEGSGVGLAIAKRIVERHGGRIWLESTPGEGTTFFFTMLSVSRKATTA